LSLGHKDERVVEALKRLPICEEMTAAEIQTLGTSCYLRKFKTQELIYTEGSPSAATYFVVSGSVGLYKKRRSQQTDRVQYIPRGKFFGDAAFYANTDRKTSAKALEDTQTIVLFKSDFETLVRKHPALAIKVLLKLTHKVYNDLVVFQTEFHELSQKMAKDELLK